MNGWQLVGMVYLAIGVAVGVIITSRDAIDWMRRDPELRRTMDSPGGGIGLLIAAMIVVVAWPAIFAVGDDDDGE